MTLFIFFLNPMIPRNTLPIPNIIVNNIIQINKSYEYIILDITFNNYSNFHNYYPCPFKVPIL